MIVTANVCVFYKCSNDMNNKLFRSVTPIVRNEVTSSANFVELLTHSDPHLGTPSGNRSQALAIKQSRASSFFGLENGPLAPRTPLRKSFQITLTSLKLSQFDQVANSTQRFSTNFSSRNLRNAKV